VETETPILETDPDSGDGFALYLSVSSVNVSYPRIGPTIDKWGWRLGGIRCKKGILNYRTDPFVFQEFNCRTDPFAFEWQFVTRCGLAEAFERGPFVVPPDLAYGRGFDEDECGGVFHLPDVFRQPLVCRRRDDELVAFQVIHTAK